MRYRQHSYAFVLHCGAAVSMQCFLSVQKAMKELQPMCGWCCRNWQCFDRSEIVFASGVIPIDRLTDVRTPVAVVCERIARPEFERVYGLKLPKPDEHDALNK